MLEYIFFEATLRGKFITFAEQHGVPCTASDDPLGMIVAIPEDLPEMLADEMEAYYATLEREQECLSQEQGELNRLAGFGFRLPDGQTRLLPVSADMANRLMAHFTLEEIRELLDSVAQHALQPSSERLCELLAEKLAQDKE